MDIDLTDDLIFETDPIQEFLERKLEAIRQANKKLEKELTDKNRLLEECLASSSQSVSPPLEILEIWTRIHNDRFIIGINLKNCVESGSTTIKNVILNWNSPNPITYKRRIFNFRDEIRLDALEITPTESNTVKTTVIMILAMDKPDFTSQLSYKIDGIIICSNSSSKNENEKQVAVPTTKVEIIDFLDESLRIRIGNLEMPDSKSILAYMGGKDEFYLVAKSLDDPGFIGSLSNLCGYKEIDLKSANKLFLINNICDGINGSFIETYERTDSDIFDLKIMALNQDSLFQILHHMYNKVPNLCILPKSHEIYLYRLTSSLDGGDRGINGGKFAEALRKQLEFIHQFCAGKVSQCGRTTYYKFRKQLNQLQYETDVLYLKCSMCSNT